MIIILLICGFIFRLLWKQNHIPTRLVASYKHKTIITNDNEIKTIALPINKFTSKNNKANETVSVQMDPVIIQNNASQLRNDQPLIPTTSVEYISNSTKSKKFLSSEAVWNGRRFIVTTDAKNHVKAEKIKIISPLNNTNTNTNKSDTTIEPAKVRCPLVEKIQKAAQQINDSFFYEGTYRIVSYEPVFDDNDMSWLVGVRGIVAGSSDEAIYMANIAVSETNQHINEYAETLDGQPFSLPTIFACYYGPGDIMALGIRDDEVPIEE